MHQFKHKTAQKKPARSKTVGQAKAIYDNRPGINIQRSQVENMQAVHAQQPVQRIKIKLKDEDPILMDRLRNVPIANEGNEKLDDVKDASKANEIGSSENIILEGHGYTETSILGKTSTVGQGGIEPAQLAAIAFSVPKPKDWDANIILAGCSTGELTESVSKEYFRLANKSVNVIGTLKNIRIGSKENGDNFIGSDWTKYPENERPDDLDFIDEVEDATKEFWTNIINLNAFANELKDFVTGKTKGITLSIKPIEETASKLVNIDSLSKSVQVKHKNYKLNERKKLYLFFEYCIHLLGQIDFFDYPDKVKLVTNKVKEEQQYTNFHKAVGLLSVQEKLYSEIIYYLTGLKLKEIDLFDKKSTKHSKMKRTKKGFFDFLDTWENE